MTEPTALGMPRASVPAPTDDGDPRPLDPGVVERFVEMQVKELEIRQEETALRREQLALDRLDRENAHDYALRLLEAQLVDRDNQRASDGRAVRWGAGIVVGSIVVFALLAAFAMWCNKDEFLSELIRIVGYGIGGGGVGYAVGRNKKEKPLPSTEAT